MFSELDVFQESPMVYYTTNPILSLNYRTIEYLIKNMEKDNFEKIRLCTHHSVEDLLHEMIIILKKNAYVRPHKHLYKSESFHVIKGEAEIILFDDDGKTREIITLGDQNSGKNFYYRLDCPLFHTVKVSSEYFIFHETTQGPFDSRETIYPDWD